MSDQDATPTADQMMYAGINALALEVDISIVHGMTKLYENAKKDHRREVIEKCKTAIKERSEYGKPNLKQIEAYYDSVIDEALEILSSLKQ